MGSELIESVFIFEFFYEKFFNSFYFFIGNWKRVVVDFYFFFVFGRMKLVIKLFYIFVI